MKAYKPLGHAEELFLTRDKFVVCEGPARTGKSRAALEKLLLYAYKYPGVRALICRKVRRTLSESTLQIFEDSVVPRGTPWVANQHRSMRSTYELPNGSIVVIIGLDNAEKVKSSEFDYILIDEGTELELEDFEILSSRLSGRGAPYRQLAICCNPDHPAHWIKKHIDSGEFKSIRFEFADNPVIDADTINTLSRLTGHRRARLYEGIWSAAEGLVFDISENIVENADIPKGEVYGGRDFGWSAPGAAVVGTVYKDQHGRDVLYVHDCFQQANMPAEVWAQKMLSMGGPDCCWFADPSNPEAIREMLKHNVRTYEAVNSILFGIDAVNSLIEGERLFVSDRCVPLIETCSGYVYDKDGVKPLKEQDHLPDALRYLCASVVSKNLMEVNALAQVA